MTELELHYGCIILLVARCLHLFQGFLEMYSVIAEWCYMNFSDVRQIDICRVTLYSKIEVGCDISRRILHWLHIVYGSIEIRMC